MSRKRRIVPAGGGACPLLEHSVEIRTVDGIIFS